MEESQFTRTELLYGKHGMEALFAANVAVFGIGGVGGYAVEALARSGIGRLALFDNDKFCVTNLNRQLHATHKTLGQYKVVAAKKRISEINPACEVSTYKIFYLPESAAAVDLSAYDYIIDAIDTVAGKIELARQAHALGVPIISSMGAGNKTDASAFEVTDIFKTSACPLAKVMRGELKKRGIPQLKVVYSKETPLKRLHPPGSTAFVPSAAGLIMAGEVINFLTNGKKLQPSVANGVGK